MNYYNEIKQKIKNNEIYLKVKDYSKERNTVITYFEIGRLLTEAGSKYGDGIIQKYSDKLIVEVGKRYNKRTLFRMRQFYLLFNNHKLSPLVTQLSWSHYIQLLPLKNYDEIMYYISISKKYNLSKRQLEEKIKNKEYERLDDKTKEKLINREELEINDLVKNPILIKNNNNYIEISENILKKLILEDLPEFLTELGEGFSFIKDEYKIKLGDRYNYIDLLLFNYIYNCFVVIELKITELKAEHIGQIQKYMNFVDKNLRRIDQDRTIGIIICKKENRFVMEYCSDERILAKEYELL